MSREIPNPSIESSQSERLKSPGVSYYGRVVTPKESPEILLGNEHAIFNAAVWRQTIDGKRQTFCLPRVMTHEQRPQVADTTDRLDFITWQFDKDGLKARIISRIPTEVVQGEAVFNPEDSRALVLQNNRGEETGEVLFGLTAADEHAKPSAMPYPAFFSARYPFLPSDISPMEVLSYLPPGKNLLPLSADTAIYRPEFNEDESVNGRTFNFIKKTGNKWETIRTITFPDVDWVANGGRFGLTGGEKIPTGEPGVFRMIIHGFLNSYKKEGDNSIVTYALGLAEFQERDDGTFDIRAIDNTPLLTYQEAIKYAGDGTEPDPHKKVIYSTGYILEDDEALVPVTLRDKEIALFGFSKERLLQPFTTK